MSRQNIMFWDFWGVPAGAKLMQKQFSGFLKYILNACHRQSTRYESRVTSMHKGNHPSLCYIFVRPQMRGSVLLLQYNRSKATLSMPIMAAREWDGCKLFFRCQGVFFSGSAYKEIAGYFSNTMGKESLHYTGISVLLSKVYKGFEKGGTLFLINS